MQKTFELQLASAPADVGATFASVRWFKNDVLAFDSSEVAVTATSVQRPIEVADGDTIRADLMLSNAGGSPVFSAQVQASVAPPPAPPTDPGLTLQQID